MNLERKCGVMGMKMKFGCLVKKGVAEVRERDLPEVGPYDVLLHMKACNICTTDYGQWLGLREHQGYPMAGGHEAAGIVEQVGEKVTDLKNEVGKLEDEVINLQRRDRVVGMAEKKGLKTNQEQVVVMGEDLEDK